MNTKDLRPGQKVLLQMNRWDIDGIPVEYNKELIIRNQAPGNKIFLKGYKHPVKHKRIRPF